MFNKNVLFPVDTEKTSSVFLEHITSWEDTAPYLSFISSLSLGRGFDPDGKAFEYDICVPSKPERFMSHMKRSPCI